MIIGKDFIWLHFPKCAGTETEQILRRHFADDPTLAFDAIDPGRVIWHHSISMRERYDPAFRVRGRAIICNIRRLPNWLLSRVHAGRLRSPEFHVTREMLLRGQFFRPDGQLLSADDLMRRYSAPPVSRWIRTEHFAADFVAAFSGFLPLSGIALDEAMQHTNTSAMNYIREVRFYFTPAEIEGLYRANPLWAEVERLVYGSVG